MILEVSLPGAFGRFNTIKRDNFPFGTFFEETVAAICRKGLEWGVSAPVLTGELEDILMGDNPLPDIPDGGEQPVHWRQKTERPEILAYFKASDLSNRQTLLLFVRLLIRLSVSLGTSLPRMTKRIEALANPFEEKEPAEAPVAAPKTEEMPKVRVKRREEPKKATVTPDRTKTWDLIRESEKLLDPDEEEDEEESGTQVQTNPYLNDFM